MKPPGRTRRHRRCYPDMKILACNGNRPLAEAISAYLDLPLTKASVPRFSDMEVFVEIHENVRARDIARRLDADLVIVDKRRERAGVSEVVNIIGDVAGRRCILIDDIVDTAGTLCNAAVALVEAGASTVYAYVTHGVLSGGAVPRVVASPIEMLVITDSIVATEAVRAAHNIRQVTIAPLIAEAIQRISEERSVSSLFD